ncbi:hemin ABC transporter substrate-binding protein [Nitratireductor sp.]|uniref:heme/hemin ABC transporter substrate-binding protein n=1 Tax=Nitratireductor sp. TaxID=1872084 RepID=UPI002613EF12|nr:ABC transporter substrate-binding protein [Nitratireductor sp.]
MPITELLSGRALLGGAVLIAGLMGGVAPVAMADEALPKPFPDTTKVVSIGGEVTEIVYRLGEEDRLVARDQTSIYPAEVKKLPDVGYMRALSPEGVLSVGPSAILAAEGSGPAETMGVLEKAGIPLVTVPEGFDREAILRKVRVTGAALGVNDKAEALARELEADLEEAETLAHQSGEEKRVLFILSVQAGRIMAAGRDNAADGIIRMAGGANAMDGFIGYKLVSEEAVIAAKPDVVLMMTRGDSSEHAPDDIMDNPAIASTPAGENRALIRMDGSYLLGFGPRTADAIRELSKKLHGAGPVVD